VLVASGRCHARREATWQRTPGLLGFCQLHRASTLWS
jgi:hypothetical protein